MVDILYTPEGTGVAIGKGQIMGVDNNAILFIGLPLSEITEHLL